MKTKNPVGKGNAEIPDSLYMRDSQIIKMRGTSDSSIIVEDSYSCALHKSSMPRKAVKTVFGKC